MSVFENIRCALLWSEGYRYSFWQLLGRQRTLNEKALDVLEQIGLSDKAQLPSGELAYAQQRALELGIAVASGAELIMLDEPVAGMSNSEAENAVALIRRITEGKTLIMVEPQILTAEGKGLLVWTDGVRPNTRPQAPSLPQHGHAPAPLKQAVVGLGLCLQVHPSTTSSSRTISSESSEFESSGII